MPVFQSAEYRYRISGAVVAGPSHQAEGIPCEDAWDAAVFGRTGAAVAVADGLGSAEHAKEGAMVAVSAAITALSAFFDPWPDGSGCDADIKKNGRMVRAACKAARDAVVTHAASCGLSHRSFDIILLSAPSDRRYVNEVRSLMDDAYEDACVVSPDIPAVSACSVFTDGCERLFLDKKSDGYHPYEPFFQPFFSAMMPLTGTPEGDRAIADLLVSDRFITFSEDDKTLVVIVSGRERGEDTE
jgi:hypothetical protein